MRTLYLLSATLFIGTASAAYAQEGQNSHTLNEQVQRINQGEAPIPAPWERTPSNGPVSAPVQAPVQASAQPMTHIDSQGSGAIPALPLPIQTTAGGTTYITGGVGDEELAELKAKSGEFNLHLLLTAPGGAFVSDVHLRVADASGAAVLDITGAGPYVYAHLKPGKYMLDASAADGPSKQLKFTIHDKGDVKQQLEFQEEGGLTSDHKPTATIE